MRFNYRITEFIRKTCYLITTFELIVIFVKLLHGIVCLSLFMIEDVFTE